MESEVTAIAELNKDHYVFGHNTGITFLNHGAFFPISFTERQHSNVKNTRVLDIRIDSTKNVWAAVNGLGIAKIDTNGTITWYKRFPGKFQSCALNKDSTGNGIRNRHRPTRRFNIPICIPGVIAFC